jgi:hypothetical protein
MLQGKITDNYYCYECLSPIDDFTQYEIISDELLNDSGDVLCENCYDPELLAQLQLQEKE